MGNFEKEKAMSAAKHWSALLVDQKFEVPGGTTRASELARQLVEAFDPAEDIGIIPDLETRKLELRGVHDTRASEVADTIWRTVTALEERIQTATQSSVPADAEPSDEMRVGENDMRFAG
ncbi:MAG: hypothetical protein Q7S08_00465 [bacterium]|nr:hypothetical protein [bacterium]